MKELTIKVASTVASVVGVVLSIAILQDAGVPFPAPLAWNAWSQWGIFAAVAHVCISLCVHGAERITGTVPGNPAGTSSGPA